ncbi:hypothetical protein BaRGS_00017960, partial [Batillaria attramentaria]
GACKRQDKHGVEETGVGPNTEADRYVSKASEITGSGRDQSESGFLPSPGLVSVGVAPVQLCSAFFYHQNGIT